MNPAPHPVWIAAARQYRGREVSHVVRGGPTVGLSDYRNYATFSGRASRSEFWRFWLFYLLVFIVLSIVAAALNSIGPIAYIAIVVFAVGSLIPSIAVAVRRLHDIGRSGWWLLLGFIPLGGLVLLIFYLLPSTPGPNAFGAGPARAAA